MMECEGISTALSVLLSRFRIFPRVCYYDNACNLSRSILLRVPWVNEECVVVYECFHKKSHKCNSLYKSDTYSSCRNHRTSGEESINSLWNMSETRVRFLSVENMIPFLTARAGFMFMVMFIKIQFPFNKNKHYLLGNHKYN